MKKTLMLVAICAIVFMAIISICPNKVNAVENSENHTSTVIDSKTESTIGNIKETHEKNLEWYKNKYHSDSYGLTAYILHIVQIYSIPFCFLAIVVSIIYRVVIGVRHLENAEKGLGMIVAIVTLTIICQILPLVFAVVVKLGKE